MIPLYGFRRGDTMGVVILAQEGESVRSLGEKLQQATSVRVAPAENFRVLYQGKVLNLEACVQDVGFQLLDRFDVE